MSKTIPDSELRKEKALQRLGTRDPICSSCPETDWRCMEQHHIAGQKHHDETVLACRNCHRKLSDDQLDHPADLPGQHVGLATIGHYLTGLADLFALMAERLREFGHWLIEEAQALTEGERRE